MSSQVRDRAAEPDERCRNVEMHPLVLWLLLALRKDQSREQPEKSLSRSASDK